MKYKTIVFIFSCALFLSTTHTSKATDVDPDVTVIETVIDNLIGEPAVDPIPEILLESTTGQDALLGRRSFFARYAALNSIPNLVAGWRMPGTQAGEWLNEMRNDAAVPPDDIDPNSSNPSYREIIHALSVERFNSGQFAAKLLEGQAGTEREKLVIDSLYLMQLRDYYELLERTALILAVQVALTAEAQRLPSVQEQVPR